MGLRQHSHFAIGYDEIPTIVNGVVQSEKSRLRGDQTALQLPERRLW